MGNEIIFSICWHCFVCNLTRSSSVYGILSDFPSYNVGFHTKFHTNSVVLLLQSNWSGSGTSDAFLVCSYPFTLLECLSKVLDKSPERKTKAGCRPKCTITIIYHQTQDSRRGREHYYWSGMEVRATISDFCFWILVSLILFSSTWMFISIVSIWKSWKF